MDNQQFAAVLQGAVAGRHEDLEQILELYEPLIRKHSLHSGTFNEDLHQYLLIHIALNINKFPLYIPTPENYSPGFPHLCTKFPENFWKFIRNASSQRLLYSYGHPHAMHLENCTRTSSVHPFVWRAAIHLTVWQNHEHLCVGGTHVAR